jgi:hypothetical protein
MKKSVIMMCFAALAAVCTPALASQSNNTPPVKQEIRIVKESDLKENEVTNDPMDKAEANANGQESTAAEAPHGGYVVISGAGLLLLIILLIILL